ncbi:tandem-95 repeat protein [Winogradskyella litoriviva]|uniref:Tandem-95 repeat protein n=1 Tax=Winogradskyella litoriviva TaxID=1220182 RepID=A0ABX2E2L3_9FLAO|nr:Ig-like domain-containing protein [Winogradskyella litoriviva]NRD22525.1 tandem-95 repeat protein [Winogradskyella litoriviva]
MEINFTSSFFKLITVCVISLLFINNGFAQEQSEKESDYWPKTAKLSGTELKDYMAVLKKRAKLYNANKSSSNYIQKSSETNQIGTCNVITCGSFNALDITPNNNGLPPEFQTAVDGSTYSADVVYDCWNDEGTVDYSEGQYISYSNIDANIDTPAIISPSPNGGGFSIFSYKNEGIEQNLEVLPNATYKVCFEIAVIPRYSNNDGSLVEFNPNLNFGIGSGGVQITDPLTYTDEDLTIHPLTDFPNSLSTATTGPFQNPGGWTDINPFWETVCITFQSDSSGIVNVFYQTQAPGKSIVLVDGLRLSLEGYTVPPTMNEENLVADNNGTDIFCDAFSVDLNSYITSTGPAGSELTWSTNSDPLNTSAHLTDTVVSTPDTYYVFYYNPEDQCSSPTASITLAITDLDAVVGSQSNADCVGDSNGSVTIAASNGNPPYTYALDGGSVQNSNTFDDLNIGNHVVEVTDSNNCSVSVNFEIIAIDTEAPTASNLDPISVQCIDDVPAYNIEDVDDETDNVTRFPVVAFVSDVSDNLSCPETITRTYSVTDDCGNSINVTQLITINDTIAPSINTSASDVTIECGVSPDGTLQDWLDNNGGASASDNCGNVTWSNNYDDGISDCSASTTVIFTATDDCGNTAITRATYTIQDTTPPVITVSAANQSIECNIDDSTQNVQSWLDNNGGASATDDCSAIIWSNDFTSLSGGCGETGSATVTFTATDACGNSTSTTATFNSVDTTNPVAPNAPADSYFNCIDDVPAPGQLTATDNCKDDITVTGVDTIDNSNPCSISIVRTWTFVDDCGNSSSVSQNIIVADTTAPTFTVPADIDIQCGDNPNNLSITGDVTDEQDNCSTGLNATYTDSVVNGSCTNTETITRTWTLIDDCNNTTRLVQTINVVDTTAPTLTIPSNVTVECTDPTNPSATGTATGSDSCGNVTISYNDTSYAKCGNTEKIKRTWTATDECGNTKSLNQIINVKDTTPPTIDTSATNIMIECGVTPEGTLQDWLDNNGGASASDTCGNVTWSNNYNDGVSDCSASTTVIFTATDDCGNTSTTSASYTIQDTTPPVITVSAANQSIECNIDDSTQNVQNWLDNNGGASATDDCSAITWTNNFTSISDGCGETGSATVTFTATDACGNSTSTTATFNSVDTTNPVAPNAPADSYFNCIDDVPAPGQLTATDNCKDDITVTGVDTIDNSNPCSISIVRTWTFVDDCGNSSSVSQNIIVADTTAPTFTVPADIDIQCGDNPNNLSITGDVTDEKDNCSTGLNATYTDSVVNGSCTNTETITRTWTLIDDCNNTTRLVQTINVVDTTPPTLIIPGDVIIECTNSTDTSSTGTATASDSCGNVTISYNDTSTADCGNTETITRTWTATDECGNTKSLNQIINVEDTTPPTIDTSSSNIMIECGVTPEGTLQDWLDNNGGASASDTCGNVTWSNNYNDGVSDCSASTTVIFTATDDCGNTSTTSASYTIQDTTPPVITVSAANQSIECNIDDSTQSIQSWLDNNGGASATDDCSAVIWSNDFTSLSNGCGESGSATVTFTATDACGNSTSTTATFNSVDTTNPVAPNAPADVTLQCIDDVPTPGQLTATDNCMDDITVTGVDSIDNSNPCSISIVRTWTFVDDCGNSSSVSQNIIVADTTAPTFTAPADVDIECGTNTNDLSITGDVTDEKDNCSIGLNATYTDTVVNGSCTNTETITRTWTLIDDCNNTTRLVQTINVIDTTPPAFTVPSDITIECDVDATDVAITGDVTDETDNCSTNLEATFTDTVNNGSCANESLITRTWSLTDGCNNTTTAVQTITVQDNTAPIIDETRIRNIEIQCGVTPEGTLQDWLDNNAGATATDNCGSVTWTNDFAMNTDVDCANGAITVIFTATDDCGNVSTTSATYAIQDTTPPVITNPAEDQTIECNIDGGVTEDFITWLATNGGAEATDNCTAIVWSHDYSSLSDGCGETGSATVTFTATDGCGNSTTTTATFNSVDTTNPVAPNAPSDLTFQCIDEVPAPGQLTASDNCMDNITVTGVDTIDNSNPCNITIVRTWTFIDDCGNSSSVSQNIFVADTTVPTINVPSDITIQCGADESSANTGEATGNDNCGDLTITYSDSETSSCGNTKTITRTWTGTDACNNSISDTQIINVIDTTAPTFNESLPANITVDSNSIPTSSILTASDNCDDTIDVIFSETLIGSNCDASYTIERNWQAEDDCGNSTEHTQIINVNHNVLSITVDSKTDVLCFGENTGAIDISVSGGLPPYSYSWSTGATSQDLDDISAGNYTITVEDNNGCTVYKDIYIDQPANALSLNIDKVNATSIQGCIDGTATANVSGGTANYTYLWSASANNQTTATATNLPIGIHSVLITDANNCTITQSIEISCTNDCDTNITTGTTTNVLCFSEATGATSVSASSIINPTATFTFTWSNGHVDTGVTTSSISNVIAGNYTVSVSMDGSSCDPVVQNIEITQPLDLTLTVNKVNATSAQGCDDGTATASTSGGNGPYTYLWSASAGNSTDASVSGLPVGDHTVVVTDANDCTATQTITISCTDDCDTATTSGTIVNVLCFGEATGEATVSASSVINPTATYTFTWSNGDVEAGVTSSTISNVLAGNYTVSVSMDGSSCDPVIHSISINQPLATLSGSINSQTDIICGGLGEITIVGSGGTSPYSFSIDGGSNYQTSGTFSDLNPGNYSITILDSNNCTITVPVEILINCTDAIADINNTYVNLPVSGNVLTNDEDFEGDNQTVTANTNPANGSVVMNPDGSYTYTPNPGFIGQDTFQYTICDDGNPQACDTATVYIEVLPEGGPENEAPIANADTATTPEGTPINIVILANDFDPDADPITITATTDPANGTITLNPDGTITYTPDAGFIGEDTFTYTICDDGNPQLCDTATVTVTVQPSGTPNTTNANDDAYNTTPGADVIGNVLANDNDIEGDTQTVTTTTVTTANGVTVNIDPNTGIFTYTPDAGFSGTDSFIYTICDNGSPVACDDATVYITVGGLANTTDAIADINNTYVNLPVSGNVLTNDEDFEGDNQTVTANTNPANGSVVMNPDGSYTYTPNPGFIGQDTFQYTICDDGNPQACDTATVYIEVLPEGGPENEAPIANADTATTPEGTPINIVILANDFDPDADPITITATTDPANGTITLNPDGTITYTPDAGFIGEDTFTYTICDDGNPQLCDTATVTVTVQPSGTPNTTNANDDAYNVTPTSVLNGNVLANDNDIEGDTQTVTTTTVITAEGVTVNIDPNTGAFTYTPNAGYSGTDSFIYTICDNGSPVACDDATVYITIEGVAGLSIVKSATSTTLDCVAAGDSVTYNFTVTNSGDVLINSITIIDDLLGGDITTTLTLVGDNGDGILDPSETWVFTAPDYTITQDDVDAGNITNNVTANGLEPDGTTPVVATDTYIIDANNTDVTLCNDGAINIVKDASTTNTGCVGEGDLVTYTFTVTNTGDVSINSITITDDLLGGDITSTLTLVGDNGDGILDPTETWVFTAPDYTITQDDVDAGNITNNVTANGLQPDGTTSVVATDTYIIDANNTDVTLCNDGAINIVKDASTPNTGCVGEGDLVTYTFTVTNTGDVSINSITITDDLLGGDITATLTLVGDSNSNGLLDPTETWVFTAPDYTITQDDVDAGNITNNVTANGLQPDGTTSVVATDTYIIDANNTDVTLCNDGAINIVKDASTPNTGCVGEGDLVTYTFTVTNTGDVSINSITITDDLLGGDITATLTLVGDSNSNGLLDPTETWVFTAPDYTITQDDVDAGNITNNVTANGLQPDGTTSVVATDTYIIDANNTDVTLCNDGAINIVKDASTPNTGCVGEGDLVTYTFTVTNTGDVSINSITITDDLLGGDITATLTLVGDSNSNGLLDPTETWVFTAPDYTITQDDVDAGNITNNVTANGLQPDGTTPVAATDTYIIDANNTDVTLCNESGIELVKTGIFNNDNGNGCTEINETITYTFVLNNTGDIALGNIVITDPLLDNATPTVSINYVSGDTDGDNLLDPSETWSYTATYLVTQSDIDATEVINIATVNAEEVVNGTNVNSTSQTITELIEDTTPPDISNCAVLDATIECNGADNETIANDWNNANILALENCATDACDNNFTVSSNYEFGNLVSTCGAAGTITVTYTLTDATDNASTFTAVLTLEDTTGPDLSACTVNDETIECTGSETENTAMAWNEANISALETCGTDACDVNPTNVVTSNYDYSNLVSTCGSGGTITVIYTVADDCGNTSTLSATLTIEDTIAPTFTVPTDITIECDIDVTDLSITGDVTDELDNCAIGLEAEFTDNVVNGDCPGTAVITRTWTLSDACENTTTHVQTITVQDTTAPMFNETLPADLTTECDAVPGAETLTATDSCSSAEVTFEEEIILGLCIGDYLIVRTWTATDGCDNEAVHTQIITVQDNNAPTLLTPIESSISVLCSDIPAVPNLVFEDSCSNNIDVEFNEESTLGINPEFYDITRIWTVTDDCGNQAEFTQNIAVEIGNLIEAVDTQRCTLDPEFDLFDLLSGDFDMDGTWSVVSGSAVLNGSYFDPGLHEVGNYTFKYAILEGPCQTDIELNIAIDDDCVVLRCGEEDVVISKTVTANGDGYNDFFTITGVEDCDFEIELQIFNRWGAEIYKSNNYKNDWNGFSSNSSVGNSGNVPTGTYYYIVHLKDSGLAPFTGPIYVATN